MKPLCGLVAVCLLLVVWQPNMSNIRPHHPRPHEKAVISLAPASEILAPVTNLAFAMAQADKLPAEYLSARRTVRATAVRLYLNDLLLSRQVTNRAQFRSVLPNSFNIDTNEMGCLNFINKTGDSLADQYRYMLNEPGLDVDQVVDALAKAGVKDPLNGSVLLDTLLCLASKQGAENAMGEVAFSKMVAAVGDGHEMDPVRAVLEEVRPTRQSELAACLQALDAVYAYRLYVHKLPPHQRAAVVSCVQTGTNLWRIAGRLNPFTLCPSAPMDF